MGTAIFGLMPQRCVAKHCFGVKCCNTPCVTTSRFVCLTYAIWRETFYHSSAYLAPAQRRNERTFCMHTFTRRGHAPPSGAQIANAHTSRVVLGAEYIRNHVRIYTIYTEHITCAGAVCLCNYYMCVCIDLTCAQTLIALK